MRMETNAFSYMQKCVKILRKKFFFVSPTFDMHTTHSKYRMLCNTMRKYAYCLIKQPIYNDKLILCKYVCKSHIIINFTHKSTSKPASFANILSDQKSPISQKQQGGGGNELNLARI